MPLVALAVFISSKPLRMVTWPVFWYLQQGKFYLEFPWDERLFLRWQQPHPGDGKLLCFLKAEALALLLFVDAYLLSPDIPLPWSLPEVLEHHHDGGMRCALSGQRGTASTPLTGHHVDPGSCSGGGWQRASGGFPAELQQLALGLTGGRQQQHDGCCSRCEQQNELQEKPKPARQRSASSTWRVLPGSHVCLCFSPAFL